VASTPLKNISQWEGLSHITYIVEMKFMFETSRVNLNPGLTLLVVVSFIEHGNPSTRVAIAIPMTSQTWDGIH